MGVHHKFHAQGSFKTSVDKYKRVVADFERDIERERKDYGGGKYVGIALAGAKTHGHGSVLVQAAAAGGDDVVRMGAPMGMSQLADPAVKGGRVVMPASQAGEIGSGVAASGARVAVSKVAVGFAVFGAVVSTIQAIDAMENKTSSSPLHQQATELIE